MGGQITIDPDEQSSTTSMKSDSSMSSSIIMPPIQGTWKCLKETFSSANPLPLLFTNALIVNYFVMRTAVDGMPVSDMKGMNASALHLF